MNLDEPLPRSNTLAGQIGTENQDEAGRRQDREASLIVPGVRRTKARRQDEAMRLRDLLAERPEPADRQALLLRIHDLIDRRSTDHETVASRQSAISRVTDKLAGVHYKEDSGRPHIQIAHQSTCQLCEGKYCNFFCPAGVYLWDSTEKRTLVSSGNCIECGACEIGCPYDNIRCHSPRGGYGVQYRFG